jgi:hypothetical protein
MSSYHQKQKDEKVDEAFKQFELMMQERMIKADNVEQKISESCNT